MHISPKNSAHDGRRSVSFFCSVRRRHGRRLCSNDILTRTERRWMAMNASSALSPQSAVARSARRNLKRLWPKLEQIHCHRAQILLNADSALDHVFFPDSGVVSVVAVYADGSIIEDGNGRKGGLHRCASRLRCQALLGPASRPNPGERRKRCRVRRYAGQWVDAGLPKSHGRLRPSLSRTGHGVGSVQRCAQPQAAAGALVAHDRDRSEATSSLSLRTCSPKMLGVHRPTITKCLSRELERAGF